MKEERKNNRQSRRAGAVLVSNVAQRFEFMRRLVCLILLSERVSVESFIDMQVRLEERSVILTEVRPN